MCDPVSLGIASVGLATAGLGTSVVGGIQSSNAAKANARAIQAANQERQTAQNQAFVDRNEAATRQTTAQLDAMRRTQDDRAAAAAAARSAQGSALDSQQDILRAENVQAETLRNTGDQAADELLQQTTAARLATSEENRRAQQDLLLDQSLPDPPDARDTPGGRAGARRMAEAATKIREYGSKVADVGSYQSPLAQISQAISANQFGIMPAQAADQLLRAGHGTRMLPAQIAFRTAGEEGGAMDTLLQTRGQNSMDTAALAYGNDTGIANLTQQNAYTLSENKQKQAGADAAYQQGVGQVISQLGNLGMYGATYLGGPKFGMGGTAAPKAVPGGSFGLA